MAVKFSFQPIHSPLYGGIFLLAYSVIVRMFAAMKPKEMAAYFAAVFANWPDCALTKEEKAAKKAREQANKTFINHC